MTAWSRETWKFCEQYCVFWKTTPYGKIFIILFRKFSPPRQSTLLCSNAVKFVRREIVEIMPYLPDKKIRLPLKLSLLRGSRPKSARASPQHLPILLIILCVKILNQTKCSKFRPNRFTFGWVITERLEAVLLAYRHRVFSIFARRLSGE